MSKPRRNTAFLRLDDPLFPVKRRKPVPHAFVLDALAPLAPRTHPMFGCLAIYVGDKVQDRVQDKIQDKIILILRDKPDRTTDNGVWLATAEEHHQSLRREFPNMRSIKVLRKKVTGWQVLPADADGRGLPAGPGFERYIMLPQAQSSAGAEARIFLDRSCRPEGLLHPVAKRMGQPQETTVESHPSKDEGWVTRASSFGG